MSEQPVTRPGPWERFWFAPRSTATLGVFRIAYGLVLLAWTAAIAGDAFTFFSNDGLLPRHPPAGLRWGLLAWTGSDVAVGAVVVLLGASAIAVAAGYRTRVATAVAFVGLMALTRRDPPLFNSGDALLRHIALFMMLAPAGAALSVDRWRTARERFWDAPAHAPWALRLVQIQISAVYFFTVWAKLRGARWMGGTAVAESMRVDDLLRIRIPYRISDPVLLANAMTWGTLLVEGALAILIWNRRARPWVIGLGIALHGFIEITFALGFFSTVMITSYVAFVPEDAMERRVASVRRRLGRSRNGALRRLAAASPSEPGRTVASPVLP